MITASAAQIAQQQDTIAPLLEVTCRFCKSPVRLNPDTPETRAEGIDPHQQMRKHLMQHLLDCGKIAHESGWLLDMLAYAGVDAEHWRDNMHRTLDYIVDAVDGKFPV